MSLALRRYLFFLPSGINEEGAVALAAALIVSCEFCLFRFHSRSFRNVVWYCLGQQECHAPRFAGTKAHIRAQCKTRSVFHFQHILSTAVCFTQNPCAIVRASCFCIPISRKPGPALYRTTGLEKKAQQLSRTPSFFPVLFFRCALHQSVSWFTWETVSFHSCRYALTHHNQLVESLDVSRNSLGMFGAFSIAGLVLARVYDVYPWGAVGECKCVAVTSSLRKYSVQKSFPEALYVYQLGRTGWWMCVVYSK